MLSHTQPRRRTLADDARDTARQMAIDTDLAGVIASAAPLTAARAQAQDENRQALIKAGHALFEALGYQRVGLRMIAERAGLSTGAIFSIFGGKDELYTAVYGHAPITPEQGRVLRDQVLNLAPDAALWRSQLVERSVA
jgi:AcrR family transcriptional regulator